MPRSQYTEIHDDAAASSTLACVRQTEVPQVVIEALVESVSEILDHNPEIRDAITKEVAAKMGASWRFCKCYRHEASPLHSLIYALCSTVGANAIADGWREGK